MTIGTYEEAWNEGGAEVVIGVYEEGWKWAVIGADVTLGGYEVDVERGEGGRCNHV